MVQRIESALRVVSLLVVAVASAAAVALDHALAGQLKDFSTYAAVAIVAASGILFELLAGLMIRRWRFARRAISGDDYIEGAWIEEYPAQNPQERHIAIITIRFHKREIHLSGTTYSDSGDLAERGHWRSMIANYDTGSLIYLYEENIAGKTFRGSGELFFMAVQGHPLKYHSKIFDPVHTSELIGFGSKVESKSDLAIIGGRGPELRGLVDRYRLHSSPQPEPAGSGLGNRMGRHGKSNKSGV